METVPIRLFSGNGQVVDSAITVTSWSTSDIKTIQHNESTSTPCHSLYSDSFFCAHVGTLQGGGFYLSLGKPVCALREINEFTIGNREDADESKVLLNTSKPLTFVIFYFM